MTEYAGPARKRIADTTEPWAITGELIKTGWERQKLFSADYFFLTTDFKKVGVERKEIGDLINSLGDRISRQLQNMLGYYDFSILLIEGNISHTGNTMITDRGITRILLEGYRNFLRTWQDRGITLERTSSIGDTIMRLNELYAYYQKPTHTGGITRRQAGDPRYLAFPPTVGFKTAEEILNTLGSLQSVANAELNTLTSISGVGPKRAENILLFYKKDGRAQNE